MAHRSTTDTDSVDDPPDDWRPPSPQSSWRDRLELTLDQRPELGSGRPWLVIAGLIAAAAVMFWLFRPVPPPVEAVIPLATTGEADSTETGAVPTSTTEASQDAVVQAAGAVTSPGVYRLTTGARVDDLIRAAGGVADGADLDRVNLAAPVADGERVWVPREGEEPPEVISGTGAPPPPPAGDGQGGEEVAIVNINTASGTELETLPGVGPATADAILTYRDAQGGFSSVEELLEVRGIGDAKLEAVRPLVVV